jgi:predicted DNA-binding protein with PD1-like motif
MSGSRVTLGLIVAALAALAAVAANAQQTPAPLPDGYMRAPAVQPGLAPKMQVHETTATTHVFQTNFSTGDEIVSGLTDLAIKNHITSGYITGLGGLSGALLAFGDPKINAFKKVPITDKCELVSLVGDIQLRDGKPYVHLHAVVAFADGSTKAGHVMEAHVAPVAEIVVVATAMDGAAH